MQTKINKSIILFAFLSISSILKAQGTEGVSISPSTSPPSVNAMLDVTSSDKGVLVPRVSFSAFSESSLSPGSLRASAVNLNPENDGLLVFVTDADDNYGYWYYDQISGTNGTWKKLVSSDLGGLWKKTTANQNNIYYNLGTVQIGTDNYPNLPNNTIDPQAITGLQNNALQLRSFSNKNAGISFVNSNVSFGAIAHINGTMRMFSNGSVAVFLDYTNVIDETIEDNNGNAINQAGFEVRKNSSYFNGVDENVLFTVLEDGRCIASNGVFVDSDSTLKKNIIPLGSSLNRIKQLNSYSYEWKNIGKGKKKQIGFLAQEIEQVYPELVFTRTDSLGVQSKSVNYIGLIPVLVEATKEQQILIDAQKAEIDALKSQMQAVLTRLTAVENR